MTLSASRLSFAALPCSWEVVHGCCDGLLLVNDEQHNICVVNPTTREVRKVPAWPSSLDHGNNVKYGFGYDSISFDYKAVVHISHYQDEYLPDSEPDPTDTFLYVYSLKSGTWKRVHSPHFNVDICKGVFLNGRIHWLAYWGDTKSAIMAFDLANEVFHYLPHYSSYDYIPLMPYRLDVLDGRLWMLHTYHNNMWVMIKYGIEESWTGFVINVHVHEGGHITPRCLLGHDEMVLSIDFYLSFIYNLTEGTLKNIAVHGITGDWYVQISYVASLVSPLMASLQEGKDESFH